MDYARFGSRGLDVHVERRVAHVVLARPDRGNAFDRSLVAAIGEAARLLATDDGVRAIVVTGKGGRAFCAGADLVERRAMSEAEVRAMVASYEVEFGALDRCPKPVIAAIDGAALGGGLELALACDLRIATSTSVLGLPEVGLAVIPGAGGTQRLTHIVGPARAKEWILFGRKLSGIEAAAAGVVNALSETTAYELAVRWADELADRAPVAMAAALEAVDAAVDGDLGHGLAVERAAYERVLVTDDRREALEAFREKRPPRFVGR